MVDEDILIDRDFDSRFAVISMVWEDGVWLRPLNTNSSFYVFHYKYKRAAWSFHGPVELP